MESQNNSVKRKYESDDDNSDSPVTNSDDDNSKLFGSESDDNSDSLVTKSDDDNTKSFVTESVTKTMSKCQGCLKEFPVNTIQMHLNKKKSCKEEYSQEKLLELKEICKEHRRQKKKASYQSKKKQKNNKVNFSLFVMLNHF